MKKGNVESTLPSLYDCASLLVLLVCDFCGEYFCTFQSNGDVAADIVLTDELVEAGLGEYLHDLGVYAREYDTCLLLQALFAQIGEVVHAGRVNEGHFTHADDAH